MSDRSKAETVGVNDAMGLLRAHASARSFSPPPARSRCSNPSPASSTEKFGAPAGRRGPLFVAHFFSFTWTWRPPWREPEALERFIVMMRSNVQRDESASACVG
jgi:hypothetical protein